MRENVIVGEVIKQTTKDIDSSSKAIMMHPLVLVHNDSIINKMFPLTSSKNFNSILSKVVLYKLTSGVNISYNSSSVENNTYVRCDQIYNITMDELKDCHRFIAFLTPDTKFIIKDIAASHYFLYEFLKKNEVVDKNEISEELMENIFSNKFEMYNNRQYKKLVSILLNRCNYISFIKEVNHKYHTNLDVESTYYKYLQDIKKAYKNENIINERVS